MLENIILYASVWLIFLMLLSMYRLIAGPTVLDRILGGNIIGTKTTTLLLLIGILMGDLAMFVDIAIAYALLNFIATLGATRYFLRKKRADEVLNEYLDREARPHDDQQSASSGESS